MKNVMLRATRTFIEDLCAPEYAHNHLAVEISHPDGFTDAQELSIRVYSCEYRLLGCDTRSLKGKKSRKVRFDILSEEEWIWGDDVMVEIARIEMDECLNHRLRGDEACADAQVQNSAKRQQQCGDREGQRGAYHG